MRDLLNNTRNRRLETLPCVFGLTVLLSACVPTLNTAPSNSGMSTQKTEMASKKVAAAEQADKKAYKEEEKEFKKEKAEEKAEDKDYAAMKKELEKDRAEASAHPERDKSATKKAA